MQVEPTHTLPPASTTRHEEMADIEASTIREVLLIVKGLKDNFDGMRAEFHTWTTSQNGRLSKVEADLTEMRTAQAVSRVEGLDMREDIVFLKRVIWGCVTFIVLSVAGLVTTKLTGR